MGAQFRMPAVEVGDDEPLNAVSMDCVTAAENSPILTLQRRHLAWLLAGAMALVGGGQTAVQFVGEDPQVKELAAKVDSLTAAMATQSNELARLRTEQEQSRERHDVVMQAILLYQIELDRVSREHGAKRSPELARAAARLQDLAERL